MTDDAQNLVLEHLRHIRASADRVEQRLDDITTRLGHIERTVADHSVQLAEVNIKPDRMDARITRIERRLDLAEA